MSASPNRISKLSALAGTLSVVTLLGAIAAVMTADVVPFALTAPPFILGQLFIAAWFTAVGFRNRLKWMPVWFVAFFVFFPPATVLFWFLNRHREFRALRRRNSSASSQ